MSTYYSVECITCDETSDDLGNHADKGTKAVAAEWLAVMAAEALCHRLERAGTYIATFELQTPHGYVLIPFLRQHAAHDVWLVSEYGEREKLNIANNAV